MPLPFRRANGVGAPQHLPSFLFTSIMLKFWTLRILPVKRRQSLSPSNATGFGHFEGWQSMQKIGSGLVIYLPHHNRHNGKSHNLKLLVSVVSEVKLSWYCLMRFPRGCAMAAMGDSHRTKPLHVALASSWTVEVAREAIQRETCVRSTGKLACKFWMMIYWKKHIKRNNSHCTLRSNMIQPNKNEISPAPMKRGRIG